MRPISISKRHDHDLYIMSICNIIVGLVTALDNLVGETIAALKEANLYDNSIIVFTSDVSVSATQQSFRLLH